jgi:death-on-curing protein
METTLVLNGFELSASVEAAEAAVLAVASGQLNRDALTRWVRANKQSLDSL